MVTIHLKGRVTDDGELIFDPPKDLPPGEVEITIQAKAEESAQMPDGANQDFTDEEIRELLTLYPPAAKKLSRWD